MTLYPIAQDSYAKLTRPIKDVRAIRTGEKRNPQAGEWFLSGNPLEAYYAPNDLSTAYPIACLVLIKRETVETIVETL